MTTGNVLLRPIFANSWIVLTVELGGFNQGVSNRGSIITATHWGFYPQILQSLWDQRKVMIQRTNKRLSCAIVIPSANQPLIMSFWQDLQSSSRQEDESVMQWIASVWSVWFCGWWTITALTQDRHGSNLHKERPSYCYDLTPNPIFFLFFHIRKFNLSPSTHRPNVFLTTL